MIFPEFLQFFSQDLFISLVLLTLIIFYGFFAVALSIQITTYNRIMTQEGFAPIFKTIGYINVAISISLILLTLLTL